MNALRIWTIRPPVNLYAGLTDPQGNPLPAQWVPKLTPFTKDQFAECCTACIPITKVGDLPNNNILWFVVFEWPTTPLRQHQIKAKLREARDTDGYVWLKRPSLPLTQVSVTEYTAGATLEDPPIANVKQRTLRELTYRTQSAGETSLDEEGNIE